MISRTPQTTRRSPAGKPQPGPDAADLYSLPEAIVVGTAGEIVQGVMLQGYMDRYNSWYAYFPE